MPRRGSQKPNIGETTCLECGRLAWVRRDRAGKLYTQCDGTTEAPGCSKYTNSQAGGQRAILARSRFYSQADAWSAALQGAGTPGTKESEPAPVPENTQEPAPVPAEQKTPVPGKKAGSWLNRFLEMEI